MKHCETCKCFPSETTEKPLHDEECENCGAPWSKHLTNKLICSDAAILNVYRFRQKGSPLEPSVAHKHWCAKLAPPVYTAMDCNCGAVKPSAEDRCTCLCPFDKKPGSHHSLHCPNHT